MIFTTRKQRIGRGTIAIVGALALTITMAVPASAVQVTLDGFEINFSTTNTKGFWELGGLGPQSAYAECTGDAFDDTGELEFVQEVVGEEP